MITVIGEWSEGQIAQRTFETNEDATAFYLKACEQLGTFAGNEDGSLLERVTAIDETGKVLSQSEY